jgi:hypothetical protein
MSFCDMRDSCNDKIVSLLLTEATHSKDHGGVLRHPKLAPQLPTLLTIKGASSSNVSAIVDNRHVIRLETVVIA